MRRFAEYLCITVMICITLSCVEEIRMDPKEKRQVNVECVLENSPTQTIKLNYTAHISEDYTVPVQDAKITVVEHLKGKTGYYKNADYRFSKTGDGIWTAGFTPVQGAKYELAVLIPGEDSITATTYYVEDTTAFRWYKELERYIYTKYLPYPETYSSSLNRPEYEFDEAEKAEFPQFRFFSESDFYFWVYGMDYNPQKNKYEQAEFITVPYPDSIRTLSTVHPYYDWIDRFNALPLKRSEVAQFRRPEDVGIEFPQVLEWGYPQYLHGEYNVSSSTKDLHYRYLRLKCSRNRPKWDRMVEEYGPPNTWMWDGFLPCEFCGSMYIAASFRQYRYGIPHPKAYLVFEIVNDDYDKYLKTLVAWTQKKYYGGDTDLTDVWNNRPVIYSNIKNGLGIFGARYYRNVPYMNYEYIVYKGNRYYKKYSVE